MSGAPNLHLLRARIAERLADLLDTKAARALGRAVGRAGHTITARGDDANAWPCLELLDFAAEHDEQLAAALVAYVRRDAGGAPPQGEATRLREEERRELLDNATVDQAVLADFDRTTRDGRARIREAIMARRLHEDRLLADMAVVDGIRS